MNSTPLLGSHNSMSYLKPRRWWMYPFRIFAQCQSKTFQQQFVAGVRCFDLRISFTSDGMAIFSHGLIDFHIPADFSDQPHIPHPLRLPVHSVLRVLNTLARGGETIFIRFILDKKKRDSDFDNFHTLCRTARIVYPDLTFIGGVYKKTWQRIYDFHDPVTETDIAQPIGSMAQDARWYERYIPYLYARRKRNVSSVSDNIKIVLRDFV